jgi:thioredoxin reductase
MYTLIDEVSRRESPVEGATAVEAALAWHTEGNQVNAYRKTPSAGSDRNARSIRDAIRRRRIVVRFNSQPVEIRERSVILEIPGGRVEEANDFVWIFAGGTPPNEFLESIGVRLGTHELSEAVREETRGVA